MIVSQTAQQRGKILEQDVRVLRQRFVEDVGVLRRRPATTDNSILARVPEAVIKAGHRVKYPGHDGAPARR